MHDAMDSHVHSLDDHRAGREEDHDQVGTVEVQILLSWFFETSCPTDVAVDVPRAA